MKLTPSSTARRSAALARSRSGGGPQTPGPVIRIAPKPSRFTVRSPPTSILPAAAAVGLPFMAAPSLTAAQSSPRAAGAHPSSWWSYARVLKEAQMTTQGHAPLAEAAARSHLALRRAVVDVAMSLVRAGVLSHSGHADLSARVGPDAVLIATLNRTRDLGPDDLAVVRLDGSVAGGDPGEPSTEVAAMHTEVYRVRPQAGAVIHTHSPHLLAFALAGRPLPVRYEPLPRLGQAEEVPVAPSATAVMKLIGERPGTQAVLLGGHGVLAFG